MHFTASFLRVFSSAGNGIVHVESNCAVDGIWHAIARSNDFTSSYYICLKIEDEKQSQNSFCLFFKIIATRYILLYKTKTLISACECVSLFLSLSQTIHVYFSITNFSMIFAWSENVIENHYLLNILFIIGRVCHLSIYRSIH